MVNNLWQLHAAGGFFRAGGVMVARVALDAALDRLFDYAVPEEWSCRVRTGVRVRVPFGSRVCSGYVIECSDKPEPRVAAAGAAVQQGLFGEDDAADSGRRRLRSVLGIDDDRPFFSETLIRLIRWISDYYFAPLEVSLRCALPAPVRDGGSKPKEQVFVGLPPTEASADTGSGDSGFRKPVAAAGADAPLPAGEQGREDHPRPDGQPHTPESAVGEPGSARAPLTSRQRALIEEIRARGGGLLPVLCRELKCAPDTLKRLAAAGWLTLETRQFRRDPLANRTILPTGPISLMPQQESALRLICADCDAALAARAAGAVKAPPPVLLYGVTGSGKTEVYLQAIAHVLERGGGAIVLIPEIALTPQTVQRFAGRFGGRIAILHSALSQGERFDEWHRIRDGDARVVIGPRSAVFAPVTGLALIVVDEEHESSYKQEEAPRYNARDTAVMRGWMEGCGVVLGSATPAMESWANARRGKYALARIENRVEDRAMPTVEIVDMRLETARSGHVQVFSQRLIDSIQGRLNVGEQVILFLNRRGFATSLVCTKCGFVAECDSCSTAYTYHQTDNRLRCHICGACAVVPAACPGCGDPGFRYAGFGTQRIETIARTCFPQARIARLDADAAARKHGHDEILGAFRSGKTDILIGTQMIAKGHHFPNVTLVGVLLADSSLHMPDYRAGERTFQLLAQVSGRSGRGEIPGHVIVQTYTPDHPAIEAARTADFQGFAAGELVLRRGGGLPPYSHVVVLTFKGRDEAKVVFAAGALYKALVPLLPAGTECPEPMPAPLARAKGDYRYQILLRGRSVRTLTGPLRVAVKAAPSPEGVSLAVDVDALSIL